MNIKTNDGRWYKFPSPGYIGGFPHVLRKEVGPFEVSVKSHYTATSYPIDGVYCILLII